MKESVYKFYDELPLFLNAETVSKLLGISPSSGYELMHQKGFPGNADRKPYGCAERKIPEVGRRKHRKVSR